MQRIVDTGAVFGPLLPDLWKAFGGLPNKRLIAKLHKYGFDMKSLNLIHHYLSIERKGQK